MLHPNRLIRLSVLPEAGWVLFHREYKIILEMDRPSVSTVRRLYISILGECTPMPFWLRKWTLELVILSLILLIDSMLAAKCAWLSNPVKPAPWKGRQEVGLFKVGMWGIVISRLSR
jgi:hypothetical protein